MEKLKIFSMILSLASFSCSHEPGRHEVYESLLTKERVQVLFVGRNWEINAASVNGQFEDSKMFHSSKFWSYTNTEKLVAAKLAKGFVRIDYYSTSNVDVIPIDRFVAEYKKVDK